MSCPQSTTPPTSVSPSSTVTTTHRKPLDAAPAPAPAPCPSPRDLSTSPHEPSTTSNTAQPSPLFRLPRELRDKIYDLLLIHSTPVFWPSPTAAGTQVQGLTPALLRTSRALHAEATPVLYTANSLAFNHPSDANMFHWTASRAHSRAAASVVLHIRHWDVRLWTAYLGSTSPVRSLLADFPALRRLHLVFRSLFWALMDGVGPDEKFVKWARDPRLRELCLSLEGKVPEGCRVSLVVAQRVPRGEVEGLCRDFPAEIGLVGDTIARTGVVEVKGVSVVLELRMVDSGVQG